MKKQICLVLFSTMSLSFYAQENQKETILFDYDSYELTPNAQNQLNQFISGIDQNDVKSVKIVGHTDSDGSLTYNETLSQNRANKIMESFKTTKIDPDKIKVDFNGEIVPVATNENDQGKQSNRRVEIEIEYFNFQIPEAFKVQAQSFKINPNKDTILKVGDRGTKLYIPKDAFIDQNGNTVKSSVEISFKEYTNSAEIAFSGIPMTINENGEEKFFSSSGMFELEGSSNGEKIKINPNKRLKIDYAQINRQKGTNFYQMGHGKKWKQQSEISYLPMVLKKSFRYEANLDDKVRKRRKNEKYKSYFRRMTFKIGRAQAEEIKWRKKRNKKVEQLEMKNLNSELADWKMEKFCQREDKIYQRKVNKGKFLGFKQVQVTTLVPKDAPEIVEGLDIGSFGTYNCDKIYSVPNRAVLATTYVDESGNKLKDIHFVTMVDPNYNGAFFFPKESITCNTKAKNVIAMFTKDGKLYVSDPESFTQSVEKEKGTISIAVRDMSEKIKSKEELAEYLGIVY